MPKASNEGVERVERDATRPADVYNLDVARSNELVELAATDAERGSSLGDREQDGGRSCVLARRLRPADV